VRVAFERDERKLGWGAALVIIALLLLGISAPLAAFAGSAAAELAAVGRRAWGARCWAFFRMIEVLANALPLLAWGWCSAASRWGAGWLGSTTLTLTLAGVERVYPIRAAMPACWISPRRSVSGSWRA